MVVVVIIVVILILVLGFLAQRNRPRLFPFLPLHRRVFRSPELALAAYPLLRAAAERRTEWLVVEAAIEPAEGEERALGALPEELLALLGAYDADDEDIGRVWLSPLLAWMLVFDSYEDAVRR